MQYEVAQVREWRALGGEQVREWRALGGEQVREWRALGGDQVSAWSALYWALYHLGPPTSP